MTTRSATMLKSSLELYRSILRFGLPRIINEVFLQTHKNILDEDKSCVCTLFLQAIKDSKIQLPKFFGDYFPYSDVYFPYPPAYWTGYYGTRPFWKKLSRETEDELRKAEILFTFSLNFLRQNNHSQEAEVHNLI